MGQEGLNRQIDRGEQIEVVENPYTDFFGVWVAEDAIRQHDGHLATRLQEVVASLDEKYLGGFVAHAPKLVLVNYALLHFNLGAERRVGEAHVELTLGVVGGFGEGEVLIGAVLDALLHLGCDERHIGQLAVGIFERVNVEDVGMAIARHDHVHTGGLAEVGVEIEAEDHLLGILADAVVDLGRVVFFLQPNVAQLGIHGLCNLATHMVEHHDDEAAAAASRVEHAGVLVRVEHGHHALDDVTRGKELASLLLQGVGHDGFISGAFDIDSGIQEGVFSDFGGDIGQPTVGEADDLVAVEDIGVEVVCLQVFENALDAVGHSCLAFGGVQLFHAYPETAAVAGGGDGKALLLIVELTEDEVE